MNTQAATLVRTTNPVFRRSRGQRVQSHAPSIVQRALKFKPKQSAQTGQKNKFIEPKSKTITAGQSMLSPENLSTVVNVYEPRLRNGHPFGVAIKPFWLVPAWRDCNNARY